MKTSLATYTLGVAVFLVLFAGPSHARGNDEKIEKLSSTSETLSILIITVPLSGHLAVPTALGEELVRRGHNVTLCTPSLESNPRKSEKMAVRGGMNYLDAGPAVELLNNVATNITFNEEMDQNVMKWAVTTATVASSESAAMGKFLERLSLKQWDIIISTDFFCGLLSCLQVHADVPVVLVSSTLQFLPHVLPPWPFPTLATAEATDDMTFTERLRGYLSVKILQLVLYAHAKKIKAAIGHVCEGTSPEYMLTASAEHFPQIVPTSIGFEFPRTIKPLVEYVGPLLTKSPDPIPDEMLSWLNTKEERSVVYISMGSLVPLTESVGKAIAKGVMNTKYSTLWSLREANRAFLGRLEVSEEQVYLANWTPQLSVLQHRAIGLAILHGGANGVSEALANGIPLIVVPTLTGDRLSIAVRVEHFGMGLRLNRDTITADSVTDSVVEVMSGEYRVAAAKMSKIFKQAGGVERAADLVEFYEDVGYRHLIPAYAKYNWSWFQYHNVDVYGTVFVALSVVAFLVLKMCKCAFRKCCNSSDKEKQE